MLQDDAILLKDMTLADATSRALPFVGDFRAYKRISHALPAIELMLLAMWDACSQQADKLAEDCEGIVYLILVVILFLIICIIITISSVWIYPRERGRTFLNKCIQHS